MKNPSEKSRQYMESMGEKKKVSNLTSLLPFVNMFPKPQDNCHLIEKEIDTYKPMKRKKEN